MGQVEQRGWCWGPEDAKRSRTRLIHLVEVVRVWGVAPILRRSLSPDRIQYSYESLILHAYESDSGLQGLVVSIE